MKEDCIPMVSTTFCRIDTIAYLWYGCPVV